MSTQDTIESVGTLLVHSKDMQELSSITPFSDECVGSLLVHQADVQELGEMPTPEVPEVNLKKRVSAGTLLVPTSDLRSPQQQNNQGTPPKASLARRITDRLNGPAPRDEEADSWAD